MADDAGALLVRSGLITDDALVLARALAQSEGGSIGEHLVGADMVSDDALTEFYRTRLLVPQVNPNTLARLSDQVIASIPADMAIDLRVIPVALGDGITIAMGDPSSRVAVDEVSTFTGTYVIRSVATQMQIAWCLAHYYGHVTTLGHRLLQEGAKAAGAEAPEPAPPPSAPPRRARGLTSKVNAARHRAMPPITSQIAIHRPDSAVLDDPGPSLTPATPAMPATPATPASASGALQDAESRPAEPEQRGERSMPQQAIGGEVRSSPRIRTLTGEIAASLARPPVVVEVDEVDSGPVVTIEVSEALMPVRRGASWQDPPELATRSGEVQSRANTLHALADEPAVVIAEEVFVEPRGDVRGVGRVPSLAEAPVRVQVQEDVAIVTSLPRRGPAGSAAVVEALDDSESAPILLEARRPTVDLRRKTSVAPASVGSSAPAPGDPRHDEAHGVPRAVEGDEASGVVLLAQPKVQGSRPASSAPVAPPVAASPVLPEAPVLAPEAPRVAAARPDPKQRRPERRTQMGLGVDTPKAPPPTSSRAARDTEVTIPPTNVQHSERDQVEPPVVSAPAAEPAPAEPERPAERAAARALSYSDTVDDGWGPPGSTIPPPWLGAIPGGIDGDAIPGAAIPISDESGPLLLTPPSPPQPGSRRASGGVAIPSAEDLVAELEDATARVVELVRRLDQSTERDQIIDLLVNHLADSHARAGFFTVRQGVLTAFRVSPAPARPGAASLKLDGPSTLQDVVDTRLPYRGPVSDDASRQFLTEVLGEVPAELLLVPVAVRERAVGVLFADRRKRHTFDEQLTVATRAAGVAFERVVRARREK